MGLVSYPMQSNFEGFDEYNEPIFDRAVDAVFYRRLWRKYFTDGVFFDPTDNFAVTAEGGMIVSVKLGECHIQGITAIPDDVTKIEFDLPPSSPSVDRTVRIVISADLENERLTHVIYYNDWKPTDTLTRNSNIHELAIADITVRRGSRDIQQSDIADLRLDENLCGLVTEFIRRTNTAAFFTQLQAEMGRITNEWDDQRDGQEEAFEAAMAKYQADWETQFTTQSTEFNTRQTEIQTWYDNARVDIAALQTFDFDNLASMPGVEFLVGRHGGVTTATIAKSGGILVAKRTMARETGGVIVTTLTRYEEDGTTVRSVTTVRLWRAVTGEIKGEVSA